jgi:hypothetical protein
MREIVLGSGHGSSAHESSGNMISAQTHANPRANRQSAIHIPDNDAPATLKDTMKEPQPGKVEKRSAEYLLKSGLAGGLAGCAVCTLMYSLYPYILISPSV